MAELRAVQTAEHLAESWAAQTEPCSAAQLAHNLGCRWAALRVSHSAATTVCLSVEWSVCVMAVQSEVRLAVQKAHRWAAGMAAQWDDS